MIGIAAVVVAILPAQVLVAVACLRMAVILSPSAALTIFVALIVAGLLPVVAVVPVVFAEQITLVAIVVAPIGWLAVVVFVGVSPIVVSVAL